MRISDGDVSLSNFTFDQLTLGLLRVKDPLFGTDCPLAAPDRRCRADLFFRATAGFGRFPDVTGQLCLNNGRFAFLGLAADFPNPGYQVYPGWLFLQHLGGSFDLPRRELNADATFTGGPRLGVPSVRARAWLRPGDAQGRDHGLRPRLLPDERGATPAVGAAERGGGGPGASAASSWARARRSWATSISTGGFVGVGMYFNGSVYLFGGVLNVNMTAWIYPPLGGLLTPGPQQGSFGGDPRHAPGPELRSAHRRQGVRPGRGQPARDLQPSQRQLLGQRGHPALFAASTIGATASVGARAVANTFFGRICSPPYPCGATGCGWHLWACYEHQRRLPYRRQRLPCGWGWPPPPGVGGRGHGFAGGYRSEERLVGADQLPPARQARRAWARGSAGVGCRGRGWPAPRFPGAGRRCPSAIVRVDFTNLAGDVNLSIRFPDGQLFTPENTPA